MTTPRDQATAVDVGVDPAIAAWVETVLGGPITRATRPPVGGSRATWFVVAGDAEAVLRLEAGSSFTGTDVNLEREATVYRALEGTAVPVPRVLGVAPGGAAVLLERLRGSDDVPADARDAVLADFVDAVAALHRLDPSSLDLPGFDIPRTPEEHARLDLQRWRAIAETAALDLDPLARYAGGYLLAHPPRAVARTCLVQGDTGPGNFVVADGHVAGLVDWEFAHVGDPMDDLAWILMRGIGDDPGPYLARYTERSGIAVDAASVAYYAVAVRYRCVITTTLAATRGGGARGWAPYLMATERFLRETAATLSDCLGVHEPRVDLPAAPPTERTVWFDELLAGLRAGVRGIDEPELRERTRNHQILVHYLRAHDRSGRELDERDREDAAASGVDPGDDRAIEAAGAAADEHVLRYLLRRTQRHSALWSTLLDR